MFFDYFIPIHSTQSGRARAETETHPLVLRSTFRRNNNTRPAHFLCSLCVFRIQKRAPRGNLPGTKLPGEFNNTTKHSVEHTQTKHRDCRRESMLAYANLYTRVVRGGGAHHFHEPEFRLRGARPDNQHNPHDLFQICIHTLHFLRL